MIGRRSASGCVVALICLAVLIGAPAGLRGQSPTTAREIIDRYFEAIGGRAAAGQAECIVIRGRYGNVFAPGDTMTLYLKKPHFLRRESYGRVVVFDGENGYINSFGDLQEAEGDNLTSLRYYSGFFHNCFSLLKFGAALESAQYLGERQLGPQREQVVVIPYEGTDYEVHLLAESHLIDRIVFPFGDPQQGTRMVNALREYKEFSGVTMPTELTFDIVGREAAPMKIEALQIELPESLDDSLFEKPDMRIEPPTVADGILSGYIYDDFEGNILTNVRREHMEELGIKPGEFMTFDVEGRSMSVRYVEDIHSGFKGAQLGDYIAIYYQAPLLAILMFGEGQLSDVFEFRKGQPISIWPTAKAKDQ